MHEYLLIGHLYSSKTANNSNKIPCNNINMTRFIKQIIILKTTLLISQSIEERS